MLVPIKVKNPFYVLEALQVCRSLWTNSAKGMKKKIKFEENVGLHEVFLEAVPSTIVMTFLLVKASPELGKMLDSKFSFANSHIFISSFQMKMSV